MTGLDVAAAVPGGPRSAAAPGHVAVTADCLPGQVSEVGGKAAGLGSLIRAGQRVPASFVITAQAHRDYRRGGSAQLAPEVRAAIASGYAALCQDRGGDVPVAVRSSAVAEDSAQASWAGQFQTFLGVTGTSQVLAKVTECWAAAAGPRVRAYRAGHQGGPDGGDIAVIVQELVDARAAGVMFTQHPKTGDRSLIVIESSHGLGEAVVGGEVVPDLFEINKVTGQQHRSRLGTKHTEYRLADGGHQVQARPVGAARQQEWSISGLDITALTAMAAALETSLGSGLDVEWALGTAPSTCGEQALFALQVRPITVDARRQAQQPALVPAGQPGAAPRPAGSPGADAIGMILGRLSGHGPGSGDR